MTEPDEGHLFFELNGSGVGRFSWEPWRDVIKEYEPG